jgi:hypothetical protein
VTAFVGLYLVGCGLLLVAGALKVLRPHDTALALTRLGPGLSLTNAQWGVRALAGMEAALGAVGIAYPDPVAAGLVAASYLGFVVVVLYARARGGPLATCGCFGSADTPPTLTHAVIDAGLVLGAIGYAASGAHANLGGVLSHQYLHGGPLLAAVVLCGWLAFLAMVELPRLQAVSPAGPYVAPSARAGAAE